jgi:hypothetical protein
MRAVQWVDRSYTHTRSMARASAMLYHQIDADIARIDNEDRSPPIVKRQSDDDHPEARGCPYCGAEPEHCSKFKGDYNRPTAFRDLLAKHAHCYHRVRPDNTTIFSGPHTPDGRANLLRDIEAVQRAGKRVFLSYSRKSVTLCFTDAPAGGTVNPWEGRGTDA